MRRFVRYRLRATEVVLVCARLFDSHPAAMAGAAGATASEAVEAKHVRSASISAHPAGE
jgi:hypothetical protein